jgi:plastocyanin
MREKAKVAPRTQEEQMRLSHYFGIGTLFVGMALTAASGCSSSSDGNTAGTGGNGGETGGAGGATGGSGGATGGSGGATGGAGGSSQTFQALMPCGTEDKYVAGSEITASGTVFKYTPACLKVKAGDSVKFTSPFTTHPLKPSKRGDASDNPIKETTTGTDASFTFPKAGFYPFFCGFHGPADDGSNMAGVVWVTP